ncbi:hypothetical protein [Sorangium sp. So ce1389]|uniref:hypothetical protein n=1 Tax=Sorangium sp. So ce1389 TaxID=3133336 RepID=UPI003F6452BF
MKDYVERTKHAVGGLVGQVPTAVFQVPPAVWVEIEEVAGGVQLYRYSSEGVCVADTWHLTVDEAKAQAEFEFGIHAPDWSDADEV